MEQLFNDLQNQIALKLGSKLSLIDEDYGQLEALQNGEEQYPVTFPCVLTSMPAIEWRSLKSGPQAGKLTLTVRLAFDCHAAAPGTPQQAASARMSLSGELDGCINGWKFEGTDRDMVRRRTQCYSLPGGIRVYEHTYETEVREDASEQ